MKFFLDEPSQNWSQLFHDFLTVSILICPEVFVSDPVEEWRPAPIYNHICGNTRPGDSSPRESTIYNSRLSQRRVRESIDSFPAYSTLVDWTYGINHRCIKVGKLRSLWAICSCLNFSIICSLCTIWSCLILRSLYAMPHVALFAYKIRDVLAYWVRLRCCE